MKTPVSAESAKATRRTAPFVVGTLAWVGLAAAVWWAYAPSLSLIPKSDQWWYLIDAYGHDGFVDLVAHTYSWNRTRQTVPLDSELFRPVTFAVLAAEKAWFDPRSELSQAAGVLGHMVVCVLLFAVLRSHHRRARSCASDDGSAVDAARGSARVLPSASATAAFSLTAFFALSPSPRGLVVWPHLHGYMLFYSLIMAALLLVPKSATDLDEPRSTGRTIAAWALLLAAAFAHELGQFVAVLFGLQAFVVRRAAGRTAAGMRALALFAAVAATYQVANRLDLRQHLAAGRCAAPKSEMWSWQSLRRSPGNAAKFVVYTTVQPLVPGTYANSRDRGNIWLQQTLWRNLEAPQSAPSGRLVWVFLLLCGAAALSVAVAKDLRSRDAGRNATTALCVAIYVLYVAMLVVGRCNVRGDFSLQPDRGYVSYFALLSAIVAVQGAATGVLPSHRTGRAVRLILAAGLLLFAAGGAERIRTESEKDAAECATWYARSRALRTFVAEHASEPDFAFEVDDPTDDLHGIFGVVSHSVYFSRWTSRAAPGSARYLVRFDGERLVVQDRAAPSPDSGSSG